jgi:hypothetical protein
MSVQTTFQLTDPYAWKWANLNIKVLRRAVTHETRKTKRAGTNVPALSSCVYY